MKILVLIDFKKGFNFVAGIKHVCDDLFLFLVKEIGRLCSRLTRKTKRKD